MNDRRRQRLREEGVSEKQICQMQKNEEFDDSPAGRALSVVSTIINPWFGVADAALRAQRERDERL